MGCCADKACFDRFFQIAENLGIRDAILYRQCRVILSSSGNTDSYFSALDALACSGHYMSLVANFVVRSLCRHHDHRIVPTLTQLENIFLTSSCPQGVIEAHARLVYFIHLLDIAEYGCGAKGLHGL